MAETREDAMKEAIAMSDAMQGEKKKKGGSSKLPIPKNVKDAVKFIRETVMDLWAKRWGKATIIGGGVAFLFFIILMSMSACSTSAPPDAQAGGVVTGGDGYALTDSVICAYEDKDKTSGVAYEAFVEIENTGIVPIKAEDVVFSIDTKDGIHILTDSDIDCVPEVIYPGEKGYMFSKFGTELTDIKNKKAMLTLSPQFVITEVDIEEDAFNISETELFNLSGTSFVDFVVDGKNGMFPSNVEACAVIYNSDGRCMGYGKVNLMNLNESEGEAEIEITNVIKGWAGKEPQSQEIYLREVRKGDNE